MSKLSLPVILGPTGIGKTEIAIKVALELGAEIVSCDSRQLYKYMNIGTAKPTAKQRSLVPHHMLDIVSPDTHFTAWDYALEARDVIKEIVSQDKIPLVVGGSGLYLRALIEGFFQLPQPNRSIKDKLRALTPKELYRKLLKTDKATASELHPNDIQRVMRALEVYEATGIPMSRLKGARVPFDRQPVYVGLTMERKLLYQRLETRVDNMMKAGFLDEVRGLLNKGYDPELNALQTIGYKELIEHLQGKASLDEAIMSIKRNTKRYAKRQFTWFKSIKGVRWIELPDKRAAKKCVKIILNNALTTDERR